MGKWKRPALLFILQCLDYGIASIGYITLSSRLLWQTALFDGALLLIGLTSLKQLMEVKSVKSWDTVGYVAGGILGTQLAILLAAFLHW